jgi:hypothetical protein
MLALYRFTLAHANPEAPGEAAPAAIASASRHGTSGVHFGSSNTASTSLPSRNCSGPLIRMTSTSPLRPEISRSKLPLGVSSSSVTLTGRRPFPSRSSTTVVPAAFATTRMLSISHGTPAVVPIDRVTCRGSVQAASASAPASHLDFIYSSTYSGMI